MISYLCSSDIQSNFVTDQYACKIIYLKTIAEQKKNAKVGLFLKGYYHNRNKKFWKSVPILVKQNSTTF